MVCITATLPEAFMVCFQMSAFRVAATLCRRPTLFICRPRHLLTFSVMKLRLASSTISSGSLPIALVHIACGHSCARTLTVISCSSTLTTPSTEVLVRSSMWTTTVVSMLRSRLRLMRLSVTTLPKKVFLATILHVHGLMSTAILLRTSWKPVVLACSRQTSSSTAVIHMCLMLVMTIPARSTMVRTGRLKNISTLVIASI